jgi:cephalosporin-C deacetylase-like acetyl esterase
MKKLLFFAIISLLSYNLQAQIVLPEKWKFCTGDDASWSSPSFNDSEWVTIDPNRVWEQQGFAAYSGYAWYRVKFMAPVALKKEADLFGGLALELGKIDDADITWLNGSILGKTGSFPPDYVCAWDKPRKYMIPSEKIAWGQENVIAVRVFDQDGNGGLYDGPVQLTVIGIADRISIEPFFTQPDQVFLSPDQVVVKVVLRNDFNRNIEGVFNIDITSDFGTPVHKQEKPVVLKKGHALTVSFPLSQLEAGFYKVTGTFKSKEVSKTTHFMFGFDPEKIVSPAERRTDFDNYWVRAKRELAAVDPQYKVIKIDSLCTAKRNIYMVEMRSLGNVLIRGWYSVPVKPGKYPAIMQVQGYSSTIIPPYVDYGDDIIGFGLNIRGHGNSKDDINPGFPGYLQYFLNDKELYIYRGAYMDCVRVVDFLFSRPEIDTTRVAVEGASQGGALTFATAALNNTRIKACAPQVPFLSDFRDYFKVATWPGNEFANYVEIEKKQNWDQVYSTLSYIDIKNLASWIKCPMLMGAGLVDNVCPPHINFAAYNQVTSPKSYIVYPTSGHSLPEDFYIKKMEFIRKQFGMQPTGAK